ncbi:hypothetical protein BAE44_0001454 [Dichanthelium oligosanthes]|uniref:GH16 domain-containing protein n=1 Tax=Dichanthelium oligosanthes TaxID=888268 RepID=A0A1E5WK61_9POAL|nr:hypothetical protein BAE44_0001454 [Dichanthelium oligosanthes]
MASESEVCNLESLHPAGTEPLYNITVDYCPEACVHEPDAGEIHVTYDDRGGARWRSPRRFLPGSAVATTIRAPAGDTSGLNYNIYLSSLEGSSDQDEIDLEFLGHDKCAVQTNYHVGGGGGRDQIHTLPFDSSDDFHHYAIAWDEGVIEWRVDGELIPREERREGEPWPEKPMFLYASVWDASHIADGAWTGTYHGSDAPYVCSYKDVRVPTIVLSVEEEEEECQDAADARDAPADDAIDAAAAVEEEVDAGASEDYRACLLPALYSRERQAAPWPIYETEPFTRRSESKSGGGDRRTCPSRLNRVLSRNGFRSTKAHQCVRFRHPHNSISTESTLLPLRCSPPNHQSTMASESESGNAAPHPHHPHGTETLAHIAVDYRPEACRHEPHAGEIHVTYDHRHSGRDGSRWRSRRRFLPGGAVAATIRAPAGDTAGLNYNLYLSSLEGSRDMDEIDFEFLGHDKRAVQTNYHVEGGGGREQIHKLPFDSSDDFHHYAIAWDDKAIEWRVDGELIRREERREGEPWPEKPMHLYASVWDASDIDEGRWTGTYHGRDAPYVCSYKDVVVPAIALSVEEDAECQESKDADAGDASGGGAAATAAVVEEEADAVAIAPSVDDEGKCQDADARDAPDDDPAAAACTAAAVEEIVDKSR